MTSSLPQEVRDRFERFVTTEYTTVDARQQPITWPVTPYYRQGGDSIDVTTGIGYPKKADDAVSDPRVSLLFSDATGSGLAPGAQVLVQGIADVDDRDLDANRERYWRESWDKLPGTRDAHPPRFMRGMFGWYYTRIYIKVRPERVLVWTSGDLTRRAGDLRRRPRRGAHRARRRASRAARAEAGRRRGLGLAHGRARLPPSHRRALLGRAGRLPALDPGPGLDRPRGSPDRNRRGARGAAARGGAGVPDRARPRRALQLAGELPGPRRPHPRRGRMDADPAQDGRRLRAPEGVRARPLPAQLHQGRCASTGRPASAGRRPRAAPGTAPAPRARARPGRCRSRARPSPSAGARTAGRRGRARARTRRRCARSAPT